MTGSDVVVGPYAPTSPCTPACLPEPPAAGALDVAWRRLRIVRRLAAIAVVLLAGLLLAAAAPLLGADRAGRVQRGWALALLTVAGVRVRRRGVGTPDGALVVANHVSWLDALALASVAPLRMLAKREVRDWPLIGTMAALTGTVFLERERLRALPDAVAAVAAALRTGATVGVFAEGTTRCGRTRGVFRPAAFQAALDAGAPVVPVALAYRDAAGAPLPAAAFVGDDTLLSSLARVAGAPRVVVDVDVRPALVPGAVAAAGRSWPRRDLARRCAAAVEASLVPTGPVAAPGAGAPPAARTTAPAEVSRAA